MQDPTCNSERCSKYRPPLFAVTRSHCWARRNNSSQVIPGFVLQCHRCLIAIEQRLQTPNSSIKLMVSSVLGSKF